MYRDLKKYPWVLQPVVKYKNEKDLLKKLARRIVAPAENHIKKRR